MRSRARPAAVPLWFLLPACIALLAACAAPAPGQQLAVLPLADPTPSPPRPISFPADEAPHDNLSEWWYYTGHLRTESGKRYGFELVFFQAVRGENPVGYAAHFAVTDHRLRRFRYEQKTDRALEVQGEGRFRLAVDGWQMGGDGDQHFLQARGSGYDLDLKLRSTKPPALHGGIGWISFGPAGDSYYYSRTRMEVEGVLRDGPETEQVDGLAWMDHQWGDFILVNGGGWDWFSVQLADGTELMVTVLRDQPGNVAATYGSHVDRQGLVTDLKAADLEVQATGSWRSPHSGATYPSGWRLRLPAQGLDLSLEPVLPDQELNTVESTGVSYWEGEVMVSGTRNGSPLAGEGYVELTGYAPLTWHVSCVPGEGRTPSFYREVTCMAEKERAHRAREEAGDRDRGGDQVHHRTPSEHPGGRSSQVAAKNLTPEDEHFLAEHAENLSQTTLRAKFIHSPDEHEDHPGQSLATRSHEVIRQWAEERGAQPATVPGTERGNRPGVLRFNFPGYGGQGLMPVEWEDWFRTFEERQLVFVYQEHKSDGRTSNFFQLDSPEREAE